MKSKNRILLVVFCRVVLAILAGLVGVWYYTAHMDRSGWVQQNGYYYYLDEKGEPISGWMEDNGSAYYFGQSNAMVTDWQTIGGGRYYFGSNGVMRSGWPPMFSVSPRYSPRNTYASASPDAREIDCPVIRL